MLEMRLTVFLKFPSPSGLLGSALSNHNPYTRQQGFQADISRRLNSSDAKLKPSGSAAQLATPHRGRGPLLRTGIRLGDFLRQGVQSGQALLIVVSAKAALQAIERRFRRCIAACCRTHLRHSLFHPGVECFQLRPRPGDERRQGRHIGRISRLLRHIVHLIFAAFERLVDSGEKAVQGQFQRRQQRRHVRPSLADRRFQLPGLRLQAARPQRA